MKRCWEPISAHTQSSTLATSSRLQGRVSLPTRSKTLATLSEGAVYSASNAVIVLAVSRYVSEERGLLLFPAMWSLVVLSGAIGGAMGAQRLVYQAATPTKADERSASQRSAIISVVAVACASPWLLQLQPIALTAYALMLALAPLAAARRLSCYAAERRSRALAGSFGWLLLSAGGAFGGPWVAMLSWSVGALVAVALYGPRPGSLCTPSVIRGRVWCSQDFFYAVDVGANRAGPALVAVGLVAAGFPLVAASWVFWNSIFGPINILLSSAHSLAPTLVDVRAAPTRRLIWLAPPMGVTALAICGGAGVVLVLLRIIPDVGQSMVILALVCTHKGLQSSQTPLVIGERANDCVSHVALARIAALAAVSIFVALALLLNPPTSDASAAMLVASPFILSQVGVAAWLASRLSRAESKPDTYRKLAQWL